MKILITGGCGFVGSNLAILFKENIAHAEVFCMDNLSRRGSEINLIKVQASGCRFVHGDVRLRSDFDRIPAVDLIIDAAAEPSVLAGTMPGELENLIDTNLNGTMNTLYFAKKYGAKFIFLSTSRIYPYTGIAQAKLEESDTRYMFAREQSLPGLGPLGLSEDFPIQGLRSLYGATKLASEYFLQEFSHNFQLPMVINRCGVVSGPNQMGKTDQGVVVLWMAKHFWKKELSYIGYGGLGKQARDVLHIRDLFQLLLWQLEHFDSIHGEIFNVGGGWSNTVSLCELTELCAKITGNRIPIAAHLQARPGDLPLYVTDHSKITTRSQWKPQIGTEQLLMEIFEWLRKEEQSLKSLLS